MHVLVLACMYVYTHRLKYVCDTNICICMYRLTDFTVLVTYHTVGPYYIASHDMESGKNYLFEGRPGKYSHHDNKTM